jgi:hypothetical protein
LYAFAYYEEGAPRSSDDVWVFMRERMGPFVGKAQCEQAEMEIRQAGIGTEACREWSPLLLPQTASRVR